MAPSAFIDEISYIDLEETSEITGRYNDIFDNSDNDVFRVGCLLLFVAL